MDKIATPQDVQVELRSLIAYCRSTQPSRSVMASKLREVAGKLVQQSDPWAPKPEVKKRMTPQQKKALEAYRFAVQQEDRYMGSVFVTPTGQKRYEALTQAAYEECKRLGLGMEHGL